MASRQTPPAWRREFLRVLGATASVSWAADAAGIDKSSVYSMRKRNAAFATSWDRALAEGRARLTAGERPARPPRHDKRGMTLRLSTKGKPCLMRTGEGRWNDEVEARFLGYLQTTANVAASAAAVGMSRCAIMQRKAADPAFARAFDAARAEGYERIELAYLARASDALAKFDWAAEAGIAVEDQPDMSNAEIMNLLRLHRSSCKGGAAQRYGWRKREPDIEEVRAELLRKVAAWMGE
jgi:hypothetical protein